jgi:fucose permease
MNKLFFINLLQSITLASWIVIPFFMWYWSSASDIFLIICVYQISILCFEIPTGLIGSRYWEKVSIVLGFWLSAVYYFLLWSATTLIMFLWLQILLWCSVACLSGSINTFLKYFASKEWYSYIDIRKKYRIVTLIIWVLATALGWFMSHYGMSWIFYIQWFIFLLLIWVIYSIPYNPEHDFVEKSYPSIIKKSISVLSKKDIFLPTIFIYSFLAIEASVYIWFQTQYIWTLQLPKEYLWTALWIFVLVATFFTSWVPKKSWVLSKSFLICIALCFIIPSFLNAWYPSIISLIFLYITQVIRPMDIPMEDKILNLVTDNSWATVLSFVWFYERVWFMIITVLIYIFNYPVFYVLWYSSILLLIIYLLFQKSKVTKNL